MDKKKLYRIINRDESDEEIYVLLTKEQVKAIVNFLEWAGIIYEYSIDEMDNITPVEW